MRLSVTDRVDGNAKQRGKKEGGTSVLGRVDDEKNERTNLAASARARTRSICPRITLSVVSLTRVIPVRGFLVFL